MLTARDLCTGFKFSFPLNIHQFMKSGFRKACKYSFCCKKEQTFWGLKGFVLEETPVSRVPEHSADRIVSNLQLPGKPSPSQVQLPAGAVEPLSSQWLCRRNQTRGTWCMQIGGPLASGFTGPGTGAVPILFNGCKVLYFMDRS